MELCWASDSPGVVIRRFPHNKLRDVLMRDVFLVIVGKISLRFDERSTQGVSTDVSMGD